MPPLKGSEAGRSVSFICYFELSPRWGCEVAVQNVISSTMVNNMAIQQFPLNEKCFFNRRRPCGLVVVTQE